MAEVRFTEDQRAAIDAQGGAVLVSAAAGSGKTAVLAERAVRLLTGDNAVSADRLIIVTFTTAAAQEMRRRIAQKLADRIAENPQDEWLRTQQLMLPRARISTIHSLCANLVSTHFEKLGLAGEMRIADDAELNVLLNETVSEIFDRHYESEDAAFHSLFAYCCGSGSDKRLSELVIRVYRYIRSFAFPLLWLDRAEKLLCTDTPEKETVWMQRMFSHWKQAFHYARSLLLQGISEMEGSDLFEKYGPAFAEDVRFMDALYKAAQNQDADAIAGALAGFIKPRLAAVRKPKDPALQQRLKDLRKKAYDIAEKETERFFDKGLSSFPEKRHRADRQYTSPVVQTLFALVREVDALLYEKKAERGVLDFSDLEHMTVRLLAEPVDGRAVPTPLAQELAKDCAEIMVDECQDISEVQDTIFRMLSKDEKNLFMVGDVKQSIYRFRQAMPELFVSRRDRYTPYAGKMETGGVSIVLDQNFRSRREVCDIVNMVFSQIMTREAGDIDYTRSDYLMPGLAYPETDGMEPELCIVDCSESEEDDRSNMEREAAFIASRIRRMVEEKFPVTEKEVTRPCRFSDFAVLLRSTKNKSEVYADAMRKRGVPCLAAVADDFLDAYEVAVMRNLLRVIDNPMLDVALVSVMMSPIGAFSADDVTRIRLAGGREQALWPSLCGDSENEKSREFVALIDTLRYAAAVQRISELVRLAYEKTAFSSLVYALGEGEKKEANLKRFLRAAEQYEQYATEGLSGFLRHLDRAEETGASFEGGANPLSANTDSVRILSIHASKGLEFPICIIADCSKPFNMQDLNGDMQMNASLGFALKNIERDALKSYAGLPFSAIRLQNKREMLAEEMRVLYVATTRAREKLLFVMSTTGFEKKLNRAAVLAVGTKPSPYEVLSANSFSDWLLSVFLRLSSCMTLRSYVTVGKLPYAESDTVVQVNIYKAEQAVENTEVRELCAEEDAAFSALLRARMDYIYPNEIRTKLPAKVTVTEIAKHRQGEEGQALAARPRFLEPKGLTPAQRGTVLHTFMQTADHRAACADLEREIARLVAERYLTGEEAASLNRKKIAAFYRSSLYRRMCESDKVLREYPFLYEIPASELGTAAGNALPDEKILLQGIADCLIFEEDGIVIVDYKTDYVSDPKELAARYYDQLRIYRDVMNTAFGEPVKECLLYSLHLEREILLAF